MHKQTDVFAGLWNLVSLFSNLCLFVLMPFAYFFLESEGFAGSKKVRCLTFLASFRRTTIITKKEKML